MFGRVVPVEAHFPVLQMNWGLVFHHPVHLDRRGKKLKYKCGRLYTSVLTESSRELCSQKRSAGPTVPNGSG